MTWQLRVSAVQMRSTQDVAANLATSRTLVANAASDGAQLVLLPECFSILGRTEHEKFVASELLSDGQGPVMATLRDLAAKHGLWLVGGGTPETITSDPRRTYNTAVVVNPRGELASYYRKIHLLLIKYQVLKIFLL